MGLLGYLSFLQFASGHRDPVSEINRLTSQIICMQKIDIHMQNM